MNSLEITPLHSVVACSEIYLMVYGKHESYHSGDLIAPLASSTTTWWRNAETRLRGNHALNIPVLKLDAWRLSLVVRSFHISAFSLTARTDCQLSRTPALRLVSDWVGLLTLLLAQLSVQSYGNQLCEYFRLLSTHQIFPREVFYAYVFLLNNSLQRSRSNPIVLYFFQISFNFLSWNTRFSFFFIIC